MNNLIFIVSYNHENFIEKVELSIGRINKILRKRDVY